MILSILYHVLKYIYIYFSLQNFQIISTFPILLQAFTVILYYNYKITYSYKL
jgi:hypothetical protein